MKRSLAAISVFLAIPLASLWAQNTGMLLGTVTDPAQAVVPSAPVELKLLPNGPKLTTVSDQSGRFSFLGLAIGEYELRITVPGFKAYRVRVSIGTTGQRVEVNTVLAVGAMSETVAVTAESVPVKAKRRE